MSRSAMWTLMIAALLACQPDADPVPDTAASADPIRMVEPADIMWALENRLLDVRAMRLDYHVTAEGAFQADIRGALDIEPTGEVSLTGAGFFGADSVDLTLRSDGGELEFGNGPRAATTATPAYLTEAILIGFSRMGILHNLARLTEVAPPDHAGGGVLDWVVLSNFTVDTAAIGMTYPVTFDLTVAGEPSGTATLAIDRNGFPTVRHQTVQFTDGEMRVTERYENVSIAP